MHTHITVGQFYQVRDEISKELKKYNLVEYYELSGKFIELLTHDVKLVLTPIATDLTCSIDDPEQVIAEGSLLKIFELVTDRMVIDALYEFKLAMDVEMLETYEKDVQEAVEKNEIARSEEQVKKHQTMPEDPNVLH